MTERKDNFSKAFFGDRALKRYRNELLYTDLFSTISPRVVSKDETNLRLEFEFLRGDNTTFTEDNIGSMGKTLAHIHKQQGIKLGSWEQSRLLARYQVSESAFVVNEYGKVRVMLAKPQFGLTHGDFRRRNIFISDNNGVKVIDWEFAGENIIYWDLAIFIGDMRHQRYHGAHSLDDSPFVHEYLKVIPLIDEEVEFCRVLGGLDIILDHIEPRPGEKPPEPQNLFLNFSEKERDYLLSAK